MRKQCELLDINRSNLYYKKKEAGKEEKILTQRIKEIYEKRPIYGYRKIRVILKNEGFVVNNKRVLRIMQKLGLKGLMRKRNLSKAKKTEYKYPYKLRNLKIVRPNQVWQIDITYIKIRGGKTLYLIAIIDVFSRKIIAHYLSASLDVESSIFVLEEGVLLNGIPEIANSDQGSQYTSNRWVERLRALCIQISMDGKGRWADNIFIERFWNSVKYECVFWHEIKDIFEARKIIDEYVTFYNQERPHQSLSYKAPDMVFYGCKTLNERASLNLNLKTRENGMIASEKNFLKFVNQWS